MHLLRHSQMNFEDLIGMTKERHLKELKLSRHILHVHTKVTFSANSLLK